MNCVKPLRAMPFDEVPCLFFNTIWLPNFRKKNYFSTINQHKSFISNESSSETETVNGTKDFFPLLCYFSTFSFSLSFSPAQSVFLFPSSHSSWNWVTHVRISTSPPRKDEHGNVYDRTFFYSTLSKIKNLFSFVPNIEHSSMCKLKLTWKYHKVNLVVSFSIVFQFFKFRDCVRYNHFL